MPPESILQQDGGGSVVTQSPIAPGAQRKAGIVFRRGTRPSAAEIDRLPLRRRAVPEAPIRKGIPRIWRRHLWDLPDRDSAVQQDTAGDGGLAEH